MSSPCVQTPTTPMAAEGIHRSVDAAARSGRERPVRLDGRSAERVVLGQGSTGAVNDLSGATELVRRHRGALKELTERLFDEETSTAPSCTTSSVTGRSTARPRAPQTQTTQPEE